MAQQQQLTPQQALANVTEVCNQFAGYTMTGAAVIQQSLAVLQAAIAPPKPVETPATEA